MAWLKAIRCAVLRPVRPEADHVHADVGLAGELQHLVVVDEGGRVFAVREQHDRASPRSFRAALAPQLLQGDVEGVVERGRPRRARPPDRRLEGRLVRGEVLQDRDPVVELDDLAEVLGPQGLDEPGAGLLGDGKLLVHRRRAIDQEGDGQGERVPGEERQVLPDAVLEDGEVGPGEPGDEAVAAVGHRQVEADDLDARLEGRRALRGLREQAVVSAASKATPAATSPGHLA